MDEMTISFPGGARVDAQYGRHIIRTDQVVTDGGEDSAPAPFSLFLASLGTCAGIYVLSFCRQRGLPTEGIRLVQRMSRSPATHMVDEIALEIHLPAGFPEKYKDAVIRVAEQCAVKKHLENPPHMTVSTVFEAVGIA
jgi:ribosomal protein S12 methylthiotransferase accessory factor